MLLACYILQNSQNISVNNSKKKVGYLFTIQPQAQLKKQLKQLKDLHRNRSNNWTMVSFIHNGSEITSLDRVQFQNQKHKIQSKSTFLRKEHLFESQALDHQTNSYFCSCTYAKHILHFFLPKVVFVSLLIKKVVVFMPKYYLLAGDTSQVFIFSLHKIKMSKQHSFIL